MKRMHKMVGMNDLKFIMKWFDDFLWRVSGWCRSKKSKNYKQHNADFITLNKNLSNTSNVGGTF